MPKILALAGSLRKASLNRRLLHAAADAARAAGGEVTVLDLADYSLPIYDGDLEARDGLPDNALRLKALFKEHQALMIASPEYNSSLPAALKNAIDWISREWQGESGLVPFQGKVGLIMGASDGSLGGMRMLPHLRQILNALGVHVLPAQVSVANADRAFLEDSDSLIEPARLHAAVADLVRVTRALHP